jgi:hypothetical protein
MKYWLVLVQWMVLVTAMAAPTKAPKPNPTPSGNRFLFILETSTAMSRLEHGGRQAVFDLIYSGLDGRMRKGDTYGLWTFNENVYAGFYPMQFWDGHNQLGHASAAGRFLKTQKYERKANLTNVVKQLQAVLRVAKDLNVFIITTEKVSLTGTPFDDEINAAYRTNATDVHRTTSPLITTLIARKGQFTAATVTLAGDTITLAELPPRTNDSAQLTATLAARATNEASPQKPLGEILSLNDVTAAPPTTKPTNLTFLAAYNTPAKPPAEETNIVRAAPNDLPETNIVVAPPELVTPIVSETPPNVATAITATATPPSVVSTPIVATSETAGRPEPLPAIVPAQIEVSARTPGDIAKPRAPWVGGNLMLIAGGAFVGLSLLAAVVFIRRMRARSEPSFISLGMDRK